MKKIIRGLLGLTLLVNNLSAANDTQKTELILRDHRYRAALFTTFHKLKAKTDCQSKFQVMGFYNETCDSKKLGEVFGANCKNCISVGTAAQVVAGTADVENNLLLHRHDVPANNTLAGKITFDPERTAYGAIVQAYFKLDMIFKGLYFKEDFAVLEVKHNLNMKIYNSASGAQSNETHWLSEILSGKRLVRNFGGLPNDIRNEQEPLRYAKICGSHTRTGINNIESTLGWKFLRKKWCNLGIHVVLQTPTGDRPTGEWLWEPRLGNQHWGIGAGFKAKCKLWKSKNKKLKFFWIFDYRYLFEEKEMRTLGIQNIFTTANYNKHILSPYYLLFRVGTCGPLIPAANILTQNVDVTPGNQVDTFAGFAFNWGNFVFDLGYNFFWEEEEKVSLKSCGCWEDGTYAIVDDTVPTYVAKFTLNDARPANKAINSWNINTCVAQTPSILSHTIFGGIGYVFKDWKRPLMLGLGGSYEFGDDRAAADSYTIWAKAGFAF